MNIFALTKHALMITAFVFVMMLVVEYLNVLSKGRWQERLADNRWGQYLLAALLGATPGCLGAFMVVAMYSHRMVSLGALVTVMIATSGDEAFVMFAMMPGKAAILTAVLIVIGIGAGFMTDFITEKIKKKRKIAGIELPLHDDEYCNCFPKADLLSQLKNCTLARGTLLFTLSIFLFLFASGTIGQDEGGWIRITILFMIALSLFIVLTVPDHFLEKHLWDHVAKKHAVKIFLWTLGAFLVINLITEHLHLNEAIKNSPWIVMLMSGVVGLIPESGPHLLFVTLAAKGLVPFSVLLASSIVQDGHGMLPLLGFSRKDFIIVKLINLFTGLLFGALFLMAGY